MSIALNTRDDTSLRLFGQIEALREDETHDVKIQFSVVLWNSVGILT